jgi:outer membrane protein
MIMKNLSVILNVVLIVAVGILYYLFLTEKKASVLSSKGAVSSEKFDYANRPPLAYIELDSLNERIGYLKSVRKELEAEQKSIEREWENGYQGLENQKNNFLKKGSAITQEMAQQFQEQLLQQQQLIDNKKQALSQKLSEKHFQIMDGVQKKLKDFLADYNKEKKYMYIFTTGTGLDYMVYKDSALNITNDVVEGMNAKMKEKE